MFVETSLTPNPNTVKFIPGIIVIDSGILTFDSEESATRSPLARALFQIKGVSNVFFAKDFISVTKSEDSDWDYMKPIVLSCIVDHFTAGLPAVEQDLTAASENKLTNEITKQIVEILETRVRPAVAQDGGDIVFNDFKDGVVYVELHGACSGCPSSTITLKNGIENMLKHYIPEVKSVEAV